MTFYPLIYMIQDSTPRREIIQNNDFISSEMLFFLVLTVIIIAGLAWRLLKKKRQFGINEREHTVPVTETSLPSIYIIRASDALQPAAELQRIIQNLKTENRIDDFTILDPADENLSVITDNIEDDDLILIVLTHQFEPYKKQIEDRLKDFKTNRPETRIAEIIADNIPYENAFLTLPPDLKPISNHENIEVAWSSIEQSLEELFPAQKQQEQRPGRQPDNKRLEAVMSHPQYPDLLKIKPGSAYLYARYGFAVIFGLIFTCILLFISFFSQGPGDQFGGSGFIAFIFMFLVAIGIGIILWALYKMIKLSTSSLERLPALIVDKRTSVSGGSGSSGATTYYYVTLELDDGERKEVQARGKLYGKITRNDAGVAYIRDDYLLEYRRLAINT